MRVFPDVPVCVKGNETRMGKGKGGFEYWACRVPVGRVVFEVGGGGIREEIARQGECLICFLLRFPLWPCGRTGRKILLPGYHALP